MKAVEHSWFSRVVSHCVGQRERERGKGREGGERESKGVGGGRGRARKMLKGVQVCINNIMQKH